LIIFDEPTPTFEIAKKNYQRLTRLLDKKINEGNCYPAQLIVNKRPSKLYSYLLGAQDVGSEGFEITQAT